MFEKWYLYFVVNILSLSQGLRQANQGQWALLFIFVPKQMDTDLEIVLAWSASTIKSCLYEIHRNKGLFRIIITRKYALCA